MRKNSNKTFICALILIGVFFPNVTEALWGFPSMTDLTAVIVVGILKLLSWITGVGGMILNYAIKYTIVDFKLNTQNITGINVAWKLIKDIMNIFFIFILIYEGIKLILSQTDTARIQKVIVGIVMGALLINFSLFFTKVMIDASNVVTIGIYSSIVGSTNVNSNAYGLTNPIMQSLGIQDLYKTDAPEAPIKTFGNQLVFLIGAGTLLIVAGFVFFAVSIIFIVRFIVLLILMMLSPVAYMGMALPFMQEHAKKWWNTFNSQLLFAPIYMLMTWIALTLIATPGFVSGPAGKGGWNGLVGVSAAPSVDSVGLLFNYVVILGFLIASLVIAKDVSSKGSSYVGKMTKDLTGFASTAVLGGSAWAGRKTVGNIGKMASESAWLQEQANKNRSGVFGRLGGYSASIGLYGAKTARDATYDVRNASVPTAMAGDLLRGTINEAGKIASENQALQNAASKQRTGFFGKSAGLAAKGVMGAATSAKNAEFSIPSIPVGAPISDTTGFGRGGTKNVVDERKESDKARKEREVKNKTEYDAALAKKAILDGANVNATTGPGGQVEKLEQTLGKMSDKQTETMVTSNQQLLDSQNFANALSVKQLEFLMKSDSLSDSDKSRLKKSRFHEIDDAMSDLNRLRGVTNPTAADQATIDNAKKVIEKELRTNMTASEIGMLDPSHLEKTEFVDALKSEQIKTILESSSYTTSQKTQVKKNRFREIENTDNQQALAVPVANRATAPAINGVSVNARVDNISNSIKRISEFEAGMLDDRVLSNPQIVSEFRPAIVDAILKSDMYNTTQKDSFRNARKADLTAAFSSNNVPAASIALRKLTPGEIAKLPFDANGLKHPVMLQCYTKNIIKSIATSLTPSQIPELRAEIIASNPTVNNVKAEIVKWLESPDGVASF
ncbi:MAG: hypothetical protein WAW92_04410 [Minisyncoccia bacterium]